MSSSRSSDGSIHRDPGINGRFSVILEPFRWIRMLSSKLNPTFILGIIVIHGLSEGFSSSFFRVVVDYYWKDVRKVQPSTAQIYVGLYSIPWILKPVWGILTDIFPVNGYHRRPYFVLAGVIGVVSALSVALDGDLAIVAALACLIGVSASIAISEVAIDACIARNSIEFRPLAADLQSLCVFSSSAGALLGYLTSGFFVHHLGAQGSLALLAFPPALVIMLGFVIYEPKTTDFRNEKMQEFLEYDVPETIINEIYWRNYIDEKITQSGSLIQKFQFAVECFGFYQHKIVNSFMDVPIRDLTDHKRHLSQAMENLLVALKDMYRTIKRPQVWKPTLFIFLSLALSISTHEGHFYWYTDPKAGPGFSQEFVGIIYSIGAVASIIGVIIYHKTLKHYAFRSLIFYAHLVYALSGMLDLMFLLRWNLILGIPDSLFIVIEESVTRITQKIRWMPMMVLSAQLCPLGIEGTFFALLKCIDSIGGLLSKWSGGLVLHLLKVTRTDFTNLWVAALLRNMLRFAVLGFVFLVPNVHQSEVLLPPDISGSKTTDNADDETVQLVPLNHKVDTKVSLVLTFESVETTF